MAVLRAKQSLFLTHLYIISISYLGPTPLYLSATPLYPIIYPKALRAGEPFGRPGIRQLGIPQGAKRLEERGHHRREWSAAEFPSECMALFCADLRPIGNDCKFA